MFIGIVLRLVAWGVSCGSSCVTSGCNIRSVIAPLEMSELLLRGSLFMFLLLLLACVAQYTDDYVVHS